VTGSNPNIIFEKVSGSPTQDWYSKNRGKEKTERPKRREETSTKWIQQKPGIPLGFSIRGQRGTVSGCDGARIGYGQLDSFSSGGLEWAASMRVRCEVGGLREHWTSAATGHGLVRG
jgi:hypothetical protein